MEKEIGIYRKNNKEYLVRIKNLRELISLEKRIIKDASYYVKGRFSISNPDEVRKALNEIGKNGIYFGYESYSLKELPRPLLIDGTPVYTDVSFIFEQQSIFSPTLVFDGTKRVAPELARVVDGFISESKSAVDDYLSYTDNPELVSIYSRIQQLERDITFKYMDPEKKRELEEELQRLNAEKEGNEFFNIDLLQYYYAALGEQIEMQNRETRRLLTLKDYREGALK